MLHVTEPLDFAEVSSVLVCHGSAGSEKIMLSHLYTILPGYMALCFCVLIYCLIRSSHAERIASRGD